MATKLKALVTKSDKTRINYARPVHCVLHPYIGSRKQLKFPLPPPPAAAPGGGRGVGAYSERASLSGLPGKPARSHQRWYHVRDGQCPGLSPERRILRYTRVHVRSHNWLPECYVLAERLASTRCAYGHAKARRALVALAFFGIHGVLRIRDAL